MTRTEAERMRLILAINLDDRLTSSERLALIGAVDHVDSASGRVSFSQMDLAAELALGRDTVKRAFGKALRLGYFSRKEPRRNEKGQPIVDYFFTRQLPQDRELALEQRAKGKAIHARAQLEARRTRVQEKAQEAVVQETPPSASTPTTTYPCFTCGEQQCACPAPRAEGNKPSEPVFHVTDHERPPSSAPEWKQRQYVEKELAEEGFDPSGEWIGSSGSKPGRYRGRRS